MRVRVIEREEREIEKDIKRKSKNSTPERNEVKRDKIWYMALMQYCRCVSSFVPNQTN